METNDPRVTAALCVLIDELGLARNFRHATAEETTQVYRSAIAAALEAADAAAWRPIETAPRDGSPILVGRPGYFPETSRRMPILECWSRTWLYPTLGEGKMPRQATVWCPIPPMPKGDA